MNPRLQQRRAELLRKQISACTNCHLHLYCNSPVPPAIPSTFVTPELLIIGEAPGGNEDRDNEPFVGAAGKLLSKWMKAGMGLHRNQLLVHNAVACRPTIAQKGVVNRPPSKQERAACINNVAKVVEFYATAGGRWILLLGATALQTFLPDARIGQWAGRIFVVRHRKGYKGLLDVACTFHPAAALRDQSHRMENNIIEHIRYFAKVRRDPTLWPDTCMCGKDVAVYDGIGRPWCEEHRGYRREEVWAPQVRAAQGRLAV